MKGGGEWRLTGFVSPFTVSPRERQGGSLVGASSRVSTRYALPVMGNRHAGGRSRLAVTCVWVERSASIDIEAGSEELFIYYSDLETLPKWSPWVKDVSLDTSDPLLSEWTLGARGLTFKWRARITTVDRGECIAWRSEGGLDNEGSVTFTPHNDMTSVKLAIRFNVPRFVAALFSTAFIGRFVDGTLAQDLERFRNVSLRNVRERTAMGKSPPTSAAPSVERAISVLQEEKEKNSTQAGDR